MFILLLLQGEGIHFWKYNEHKNVLMRERKRHTESGVPSTPYVVLTGGEEVSHPWPGGYPILGGPGVPYPWPDWGTPHLDLHLIGVTSHLDLDLAGIPPSRPWPGWGTSPGPAWGTPRQTRPGTPPPSWTDRQMDRHFKTLHSPRTTYAVGNEFRYFYVLYCSDYSTGFMRWENKYILEKIFRGQNKNLKSLVDHPSRPWTKIFQISHSFWDILPNYMLELTPLSPSALPDRPRRILDLPGLWKLLWSQVVFLP